METLPDMRNIISICANCFNFVEYCNCDNRDIRDVPSEIVGIHALENASRNLKDILVDSSLYAYLRDYNLDCVKDHFEARMMNQTALLYLQFEYDCILGNDLCKKIVFDKYRQCPWLRWKPLKDSYN